MIRLALLEMRRVPRRFGPTVATLSTVLFLALAVSALADGLLRASTGALRNTDADLYVYADGAQRSVLRSILPDALQIPVTYQPGVAAAGTMGFVPTAVHLSDERDQRPVMAVSVSHAFPGRPAQVLEGRLPFDGEPRVAAIDAPLARAGLEIGDRFAVDGAFDVQVVGIVADASYLLRPTIWLPPAEFATVRNAALPEFDVDESLTSLITVRIHRGADPADVAAAITEAFEEARAEDGELADVQGGIEVVSARDAYLAIPGVASQQRTLRAMAGVVLAVSAAVTGIFLALLSFERRTVLAGLLAVGVRLRTLVGALVVQAVVATLAGVAAAGVGISMLAVMAPSSVPLALRASTVAIITAGAVASAVIGAASFALALRRLDPAGELLPGG
jgi:uncharacterized protein with GYD domain